MLSRLAGLIFPACAEDGAAGLPIPPPRNVAGTIHSFPVTAQHLQSVAERTAEEAGLFPIAHYDAPCQLNFVVRSPLLNAPTLVAMDIQGDGHSSQMTFAADPVYPVLGAYGRRTATALLARIARQVA